MKLAKF